MADASFSSTATSSDTYDVPPGYASGANASSAFEAANKIGNIRSTAESRSEFESDSGDLANGRYRR